jgi:hypothetical protein
LPGRWIVAKRVSLKGKGADLFFDGYAPAPPDPNPDPEGPPSDPTPAAPGPSAEEGAATSQAAPAPRGSGARGRPTRPRRAPDEHRGSTAGTPADGGLDAVEAIRKVVKAPGREVSFVRLTADEKARAAEVVYAYKRRGQKTSENEINRIALNYLLLDHDEHGEQSILARVLASTLA